MLTEARPDIRLSTERVGALGVVGHVGVGHSHSHSGFVQDDSAGFAVATALLKRAAPADTTIASVELSPRSDLVTVTTVDGGSGQARARRGVTPAESEIARRAIGLDAAFSQRAAVQTFGRIYGQGALELPVAFQGACALATLDTFRRRLGERLLVAESAVPGNYDRYAGLTLDIAERPVALMMVINATDGGVGPDEDAEGNVDLGVKGELMRALGLDRIPTVVVESKAFIPALSPGLTRDHFMIRAQKDVDHQPLAQALLRSARELDLPVLFRDDLMPLVPGSLRDGTWRLARQVAQLAEELARADDSADKVRLVAQLNQTLSEDAGGVTFMSNGVNDLMRGAGTLPGISVVLSMVACPATREEQKIPLLSDQDCADYQRVIYRALADFRPS